ncbi:hypothetical protein F5887DRAFT_1062102 [Amanita rubescens]|nr:hypothetical protein F5887DRAFT_1062102 [Amanita rubescens]
MHSKATNLFFEKLFAIAHTSGLADGVALSIIKELKCRVEAEEKECIRKAPKEFTLDEAVLDFDLTYSHALEDQWKIEVLPDVKTFQPSACLAQLVVYLACLRQSRVNGGRSDTSVYGVATDGLSYVFVTITREGVLKQSRLLNVIHGDLSTVLGCFQYVLEMAMSNLTPEADSDDPIDLDDNPYLHYDDER